MTGTVLCAAAPHSGVARLVLAAGLLAHVLLFLRIAVLFAPELYLGPSGSDRVFYYAYVRSLIIDGDLDFANEVALRPPSSGLIFRNGVPLNKYPVGAPLLALPAYAATHAIMRAQAPAGTVLDGYERPYVYAYALSQFAFAMLGMGCLYLVLRRCTDPLLSAIAVVSASLSTELLRYTTADLIMSHAAASFSIAWCLLESLRLREGPTRAAQWLRTGAAAALVVMVRFQSGIFLLVPAVAALDALRTMRTNPVGYRVLCMCAAVAGSLLAFTPQLLSWRVMFGMWIANGYSYSGDLSFTWLAPHVREVSWILIKWLPLLVLGLWGTATLAFRRRDLLLTTLIVCSLITIYVTACWSAFGNAPRITFDNLAPIAIGLAIAAETLRRVRSGAEWVALLLPALWNVPFMMLYDSSYVSLVGLLSEWLHGLLLLC
jgi:hypothetical protein